jgi:hypothetical protein
MRRRALRCQWVLILACSAAACASPPPRMEPTESSAEPMAPDLTKVLSMHGWPCKAVTNFHGTAPQWTSVTCRDGHTYEIFIRDDWDWRAEQRQTHLQPMLEVGKWAAQLTASHVADRQRAAAALGGLGAAASPAVSALADALTDEDATVRQTAAEALGRIGPDASAAVPALTLALGDPEARVRETATLALLAIHRE